MGRIKSVLLILLYSLGNTLFAQINIEDIKHDPRYWCAEGFGSTVEEADNQALSQISSQISVNISSRFRNSDYTVGKNDGTMQSDFVQEGSIESSSFSSLQNIQMIVLEEEPHARVFRYVEKCEVDSMFARRKNKVLDFVNTGKIAEQRLQIDDALRNYYWALMLTKVYPGIIYGNFNGERMNLLTFLPLKIKSVIANVRTTLKDCVYKENRYYATLGFTYNDREVSSVQLRYFDGQSYVGPLVVRDGVGEMELVSLPADNKINFRFEYRFLNEAKTLDAELAAVFKNTQPYAIDNAPVSLPVKVNERKNTISVDRRHQEGVCAEATSAVAAIPAEPVREVRRMELTAVEDVDVYTEILGRVEQTIRSGSPEEVRGLFTPEGYQMFHHLLTQTGKVSLVGRAQHYEFIRVDHHLVLGRFCKLKIKYSNGKTFMENLVFRFDETTRQIQSIAFALTKKAETDIFNAASSWTEVSRFAILQFMEDYQTAYAFKRLDYIEKIFSNDAIIITGSVLKKASQENLDGAVLDFGCTDIIYHPLSKAQFLERLRQQFDEREYVHLTFEDNLTKVINAPRLPRGTAFAIQINQLYNSPVYSDRGYLTLILDASQKLPIIHVRLWQPERSDVMSLDDFMNKFQF